MGIRAMISELNISAPRNVMLPKFYGYVAHDGLKSRKWLREHKSIDIDDFYYGDAGANVSFNHDEFKEFMDLYFQDLKACVRFNKDSSIYESPLMMELLDSDGDKLIQWF